MMAMFILAQDTATLFTQYATRAVGVLILLFAGWVISGWAAGAVLTACEKAKLDLTLSKFFAKLTKWGILVLVVVACLGAFGFETTNFAALIAALGLAIGLALQGTLSNFASGVMLLIFRPFKVGDVITVAGQTGKVDEIELFTTSLDTPDNRRLILPNGAVFGATIENITFHEKRRVDVPVGVAYGADIDQTRRVLLDAAQSVPDQFPDSKPEVILLQLGASSVDWQVRVWCKTTQFWDVKQATIRAVKKALDQSGITIPFPQMDVHVDGVLATKASA